MSDFRAAVARTIPGSAEAYAGILHRKRTRRGKAVIRELAASGKALSLDIGGERAGSGGWLSVDLTAECDIYWDLRGGIPFADNRVERIYSSHTFEHLTFNEGQALLHDCFRALVPGGSMSICVPNARMYIDSYISGNALPDEYYGWRPAFNSSSAIDAVNYVAYMDGHHKYLFDQENLEARLSAVGFVNVGIRDFDPSVDKEERHFESIYAIGYKP